jgi:two-component system, sensor histidine kinase and response regulator
VWVVDADHPAANLDGLALRRAGDPSPPVVVLAGPASAQRLRLDKRLGAERVVGKPVRHQALWDALAGATNRVAARPAVATRAPPAEVARLTGHVLVVEDNPVNAIVAAEMLAELGCTATVVDNGREAVARVGTERFDLVLMDLHMPDLDGLGATALIRKVPTHGRHLPIVALTANTAASHRAQCLTAGMDGFLGKPFTLAELREMLSRWLLPGGPGREPGAVTVRAERRRGGLLDSSALDRIRALERPGGPSLLGRVVSMFVSSSSAQLAGMREALGRGDLEAIRGQAHSLKSASGNVGATELARLAQALEQACERAERSAVQALIEQLFAAHPAVIAALETETAAEVA